MSARSGPRSLGQRRAACVERDQLALSGDVHATRDALGDLLGDAREAEQSRAVAHELGGRDRVGALDDEARGGRELAERHVGDVAACRRPGAGDAYRRDAVRILIDPPHEAVLVAEPSSAVERGANLSDDRLGDTPDAEVRSDAAREELDADRGLRREHLVDELAELAAMAIGEDVV